MRWRKRSNSTKKKWRRAREKKKMGRGFYKADIKEKCLDKIMKEAKMVYSFSVLCAHFLSFFAMLGTQQSLVTHPTLSSRTTPVALRLHP